MQYLLKDKKEKVINELRAISSGWVSDSGFATCSPKWIWNTKYYYYKQCSGSESIIIYTDPDPDLNRSIKKQKN
jgi:hypothetical protein